MYTLARTIPVLLFFILISNTASNASGSGDASGYRAFGIFYSKAESEHLTSGEIEWLQSAGITWLMVEVPLPDSILSVIYDAGLSMYVLVPEYFPTPDRLIDPSYHYSERAGNMLNHYQHDPAVKGFGLFAYGNWHLPALSGHLQRMTMPFISDQKLFTLDTRPYSGTELHPFDGTVLLTRNSGQLSYQLAQNPVLAGILYAPESRRFSVRDFQDVMQALNTQRDVPVFFNRNWFVWNSISDDSNETNLSQLTHFFNRISDARVANPAPDTRGNNFDFTIVLLLILWGFFAAIYRFNPVYRKSVERFFLNYDFFVNDILMRRIRLTGESTITFFLSAFLSGLIAYAIAEIYLDTTSREAFIYHLPWIPGNWTHPMVFFLKFFILSAFIHAIQIAWLRVANRQHAQTYQIATFILWPHHLNLLFATIGIIFLRSFPSPYVAMTMFLIYWIVAFFTFFVAAYNMRRIHPTSPFYMALTYGLYILVLTSVLFWMIYGLNMLSVWNLANSLASY